MNRQLQMQGKTLAIIVPCYNEQEVLPLTHSRLRAVLGSLIVDGLAGNESYLLYVDDGSTDDTWSLISAYVSDCHVRGLKLAGNVGHQNALMAGLEAAALDANVTITIDADLQDDIDAVPQMLKKYASDGCDIVCGVRRSRATDSMFKRSTAQWFYRFMTGMGVKTVYNHADFRLMSRRAVSALLEYEERNLFLRGIVPQLGFKTGTVSYDRIERQAGKSRYPLGKMMTLAVDGVTSSSVKPLRLIFWLGAIFLLISLAILVYVIVSLCKGDGAQGWASIMLSIWFVGGCLLMCLSVMAAYVGRIYTEGKHRPRYHVEQYLKKDE